MIRALVIVILLLFYQWGGPHPFKIAPNHLKIRDVTCLLLPLNILLKYCEKLFT